MNFAKKITALRKEALRFPQTRFYFAKKEREDDGKYGYFGD